MNFKDKIVFFSVLATIFSFLLFIAHGNAKSFHNKGDVNFEPQVSNPYVEYKSGDEMLVNLRLWADEFAPVKRPPVNLVLVIDESGSMNERGKMTYAKRAAKNLVSKLNFHDRVGIVTYSDYSNLLLPLQRLENKRRVIRLIDSIHPTNSTNLSSGLIEGISQLKYNDRDSYINKIILLSDGLANRGITDLRSLSRISSRAAEDSIYITTMGLGVNYDEDLMMSLAEYGAGNYYFIESPDQIAYIFDKEFGRMISTIAKDVEVEMDMGDGVELMEMYGYNYKIKDGKVVLNLGNMFSSQERNVKMRLRVPTDKKGKKVLMETSVRYKGVNDEKLQKMDKKIGYEVTTNRHKVVKNVNRGLVAEIKSAEAAKELDEATRYYESGDQQEALSKIKDALGRVRELNQSPYRSPKTVEQEEALNDAFRSMASEPFPASEGGKSLIKKYKAESRLRQK